MQWEEEYSERVMGFSSEAHQVTVTFERHAAIFRLPASHPEFSTLVSRLAEAYKTRQPVKVTTRGQEILRVELP